MTVSWTHHQRKHTKPIDCILVTPTHDIKLVQCLCYDRMQEQILHIISAKRPIKICFENKLNLIFYSWLVFL